MKEFAVQKTSAVVEEYLELLEEAGAGSEMLQRMILSAPEDDPERSVG